MVELMVAMVLSLFMLGGIISVFISSHQYHRLQSGLAMLNEKGRLLMDFIVQDLQMAGYPKSDGIQPVQSANTSDGGVNGSDSIAIKFEADTDCRGAATPTWSNGKRYAVNQYIVTNQGVLRCVSRDESGKSIGSVDLFENVITMQILYGEDNVSDANNYPTRYVSAGNVSDWDKVVAVRIGVLVESDENIASDPDDQAYDILDQITVPASGKKTRRRLFTSTVLLRNRI